MFNLTDCLGLLEQTHANKLTSSIVFLMDTCKCVSAASEEIADILKKIDNKLIPADVVIDEEFYNINLMKKGILINRVGTDLNSIIDESLEAEMFNDMFG
jgi:hypothetical protein